MRCCRCRAPWRLHHGDELADARIAFRLAGPEDAPVIAVLGGISAHRIVCGADGWWPEIVGPGHGIDTRKFRVWASIIWEVAAGARRRNPERKFPPLSSFDQAEALRHIVVHLGLKSLHAIVGASYGGMVALCFAAASCRPRGAHRRFERRRQVSGALDGVAQRAAADRPRSDRTRRRAVRAQARARAGDGDVPQCRWNSSCVSAVRRCAKRTDSGFRSRNTCSRAAMTTCKSTARRLSSL